MAGLRFALLGSGSRGNATLVACGSTHVLIDCGFGIREAQTRLARLGLEADALDAILVTHEHGDHLSGAGPLARRHGIPLWMTPGTRAAVPPRLAATMPEVTFFDPHTRFSIGDLEIGPIAVPHDAREPCQFVLGDGARRLGVLSDAGHVTAHMLACLDGVDALALECNHDEGMLAEGPYPASLKARVGGELGHLSNAQSAGLLAAIDTSSVQHLVLTHLSEKNNTPDHAREAVIGALGCPTDWPSVAHQEHGHAWRDIQ